MRVKRRTGAALIAAFVVGSLVVATPSGASGGAVQSKGADGFSVVDSGISDAGRVDGAKSVTGKLAQSDPALLDRSDAAQVNVMVKLDYDAAANYSGDITGLAATSPRVTGTELTGKSSAEKAYARYTGSIDAQFRQDAASIPGATLGASISTVYGGVAMSVPANQVKALLALPNVSAVQSDSLNQPQTDSSTYFIGAPTIWNQEGGQALAGKGVIFADIDSGVWPEHPALANNPALGNPPPALTGQPRVCDFGDNPLTPAADVFVCNKKLIGGQPFLSTYNALVGGEVYPNSARDSNGHGTHTTTTAAGNIVPNAKIFGVDRGTTSGVAPGAWVLAYKVCGVEGCYASDSVAAVQQAILDGADVINYSISGGANPFTDPVELAFLGAYQAGITVAASAGNSGPGPATTDHQSPWVVTVAASTQTREFQSTLTLTDGATSKVFTGSSITLGVPAATPVVMAESLPGYSNLCATALPPGSVTGKVVACQRGGTVAGVAIGRVQKGFNVKQGGAVGMILYNPTLADTETDNHFLPTVHLADGTEFKAFMAAHPTATATFTQGVKANGQGDVMAAFSSRGPGGLFLKPDITAPGVQILAGTTPTPDEIPSGPAGELFQAIAGTSMSSPHIAGSAILLQALHPTWGPGAIKSALMTTANTNVVKEDTVTPADPFDFGAGRVDLTVAGAAPVVFEDSAQRMYETGGDPLLAMNVNIPSINLPTMPGSVTVTRTATNVTKKAYSFNVETDAPDGSTIQVTPKKGKIKAGESLTFTITISSNAAKDKQYFGQIRLVSAGNPTLHLPVAFYNQQGDVSLSQECVPTSIKKGSTTTCTVTATNDSFSDAAVVAVSKVTSELRIDSATGAQRDNRGKTATAGPTVLDGRKDAIPVIAPGETPADGYLPLDLFATPKQPLSDEEAANFTVPAFVYGGKTYDRLGIVSNGYLVVGGTDGGQDVAFEPQTLPDPARPNNVLAPFWTDLDGVQFQITTLTDGTSTWLVVETSGNIWGKPLLKKTMQVWIGIGATEDISYAYDSATLTSTDTNGQDVTIGAENASGTAGDQLAGLPTNAAGYAITTTPGEPGETLSFTLVLSGNKVGTGTLSTTMLSDIVAGTTAVSTDVAVTPKK